MPKKASAKKATAKRKNQGTFRGMEPVVIQEIEVKFEEYEDKKAERALALSEEVDLKRELMELLEKHRKSLKKEGGNPVYKSDNLMKTVTLEHGADRLKVSRVKEEE